MNTLTRIFLVLVRLAIGSLFLVEGVEKVPSIRPRPTANSQPFTAAGYLQQSAGTLSPFFQWQVGGNADANALERLTVRPLAADEDAGKVVPRTRVSPALQKDWEEYLQRFADHYGLDDDQRARAREKLDQALDGAVVWLTDDTHRKALDPETAFPTATFTPRKTPVERVAEFRAKVEEYRRAQDEVNYAFGEDVYKAKLRAMKADAARMRDGLLDDLSAPLTKSLQDVLSDEQKTMPALGAAPAPLQLRWTDRVVSYGLVVVGACLMLGLFTRLNALAGALFLIMLYLALPPFPWGPENIRAEGHYLFVNKNLVMALALLALATTRSGMWLGLDGLLQFLNPWRSRARQPQPKPAAA